MGIPEEFSGESRGSLVPRHPSGRYEMAFDRLRAIREWIDFWMWEEELKEGQ